LGGVFSVWIRDRGWVVANQTYTVRQGLLGNVEADGGGITEGDYAPAFAEFCGVSLSDGI